MRKGEKIPDKNRKHSASNLKKDNQYTGQFEHEFGKSWNNDEIKFLADKMYKWFFETVTKTNPKTGKDLTVPKSYWLRDFAISEMIPQSKFINFAKQNEYFEQMFEICKYKQESVLFHLGLTSKGAMPIFALKNVAKWRDSDPDINNGLNDLEISAIKQEAKRIMQNNL